MRLLLLSALLMTSSFLTASPLKLDHVGICGYDLKSLQDAFATVGLTAEYGGAHATGGTHNALLGFDDGSYLELIALQNPGSATGTEAPRWNTLRPGLSRACFWAIHTDDLKGLVESFRKAKLEISDLQPGGRKKPDGTVLQWQTAAVPDERGGDILPFAIQDITPRTSRIQASPSVKGSELTGVKRVIIGVKDLGVAIALFQKAYGLGQPRLETSQGFPAKLAYFPGTVVILAAPLSPDSWLARDVGRFGQGPVAVMLSTKNSKKAAGRAPFVNQSLWFGSKVGWFPPEELQGVHLGVIED